MALNSSGPISLGGSTEGQSVNLELGKSATALITMNDSDLRTLFGVASGQISMNQGYGKSSYPGNATCGYFAGGDIPGATSEIDGIRFSDEAAINPGAGVNGDRRSGAAFNNQTNGYIGSGTTSNITIDRFTFSNQSIAGIAATLVQARCEPATVNSTTRGYFAGGDCGPINVNQIDGIQFSNEAQIDPAAALVQRRSALAGVNSSTRGYFAGGNGTPGTSAAPIPLCVAQIDGIQFSNEATIDPGAALVQGRRCLFGVNSTTRGYIAGGNTGGTNSSQIDGIQFSNEAQIDPGAALVQARGGAGTVNSTTRGYFGGGFVVGVGRVNQIDGIQFSNEAQIDPGAALVQVRSCPSGFQNSNN